MADKQHFLSRFLDFKEDEHWLFAILTALVLGSIFGTILMDEVLFMGIPFFFLLVYWCVVDFKKVYFLLLFCIPLSTEFTLPNGFGTDLPTEPLMVGLMGVYLLYVFRHAGQMSSRFVRHPISLLILLHLLWIYATTIYSNLFFVSFKFSLAKTWYIIVFYFMAGSILKKEKDWRNMFWIIFLPMLLTIFSVLFKHAQEGFAFDKVNAVLDPFYRNHVNYACILVLFFPFLWYARTWFKTFSFNWWFLLGGGLVYLVAIQLSYTRAAYVALVLAAGAYFIIRLRLIRYVLGLVLVGAVVGAIYMTVNNKYLEYAPNFERTITHRNFDNLVSATYKGEDISTMERFYRWIAGAYMSFEEPLTGFGPGNFYNFYRSYTVTSFRTYVSDNPEKSGIHSYYLMTLSEQGYPGLVIFLLICFYGLIRGENIYHQTENDFKKGLVMTILLSMIVIDALLLINDMIETDKVGSFFFIHLAILVNIDLSNRQEETSEPPSLKEA
ncbi:MAG: O-antigen ligase family protein [Bacteroidota bacterium]